jgi:hypothetical protein
MKTPAKLQVKAQIHRSFVAVYCTGCALPEVIMSSYVPKGALLHPVFALQSATIAGMYNIISKT